MSDSSSALDNCKFCYLCIHSALQDCWVSCNKRVLAECRAAPCSFGAAHNAECMVPCATMLDFYNGGGVDLTCLGAAEVDAEGNVNVHSFPGRQPGCGGFIDISQAAKRVIFAGTFTAGGLKVTLHSPLVQRCLHRCLWGSAVCKEHTSAALCSQG